jgi:peptidoglycan/LPS O-acetylase OafA/YrhL
MSEKEIVHLNKRDWNNYDFLRLFAAICITYSHSFNNITNYIEPLFYLSAGGIKIGDIGLLIFFSISGYLIAKSAVTSSSVKNYFWKRILRIQPLLIIVCILTVFLLGPFFTTLTIEQYFSNINSWTYFRNIFPLTGMQFTLPNVFSNYAGETGVNGSLWTLVVEERLYLLLGIIFLKPKFNKFSLYLVAGICNFFYLMNIIFQPDAVPYLNTISGFYTILFLNASVLFLLELDFNKNLIKYLSISFLFCLISVIYPAFVFLQLFAFPVFIVSIAQIKGILNKAGRYGDFTYGIYVFSFPIQQMLNSVKLVKENPYKLFLLTIIIVLPLSALSWHLVEKNFLRLKNYVK